MTSENINYDIQAESLSVLIYEDLIHPGDQYSISFAKQLLSNPTMEVVIYNHSDDDISLSGNESSWMSSFFVGFLSNPPNILPAQEEVTVDLIWYISEIEESQEDFQATENLKISVPFSIPRAEIFAFSFEVELVDPLWIVFLGDDRYSLLGSENTDDFVHEQWETSIESKLLYAQFYDGAFWRLDEKDENTSIFSVSEDGLNWIEVDMGLADKADFCQVIDTSMICFSSDNVWVSYAGQSFEKKSMSIEIPHVTAGVTHPFRAYLVGDEGIHILHPSGYLEQIYESSLKIHHIATSANLEMIAIGDRAILYSDDGTNWQSWDVSTISGTLQSVQSFGFPSQNADSYESGWIFGTESENGFSIWAFQGQQFEHLVDLKLIHVINNMIFAIDDSNWIYRSKNGLDWQKIHKLPTHITLRTIAMEQHRNFEGVDE